MTGRLFIGATVRMGPGRIASVSAYNKRAEFFRERRRAYERQGFWLVVIDDQRRGHGYHAKLASPYARYGRSLLASQVQR